MVRYCDNCGAMLWKDDTACQECGTPAELPTPPETVAPLEPPMPEPPEVKEIILPTEYVPEVDEAEIPKARKPQREDEDAPIFLEMNFKILLIGGIIGFFILLGLILAVFLPRDNEAASLPDASTSATRMVIAVESTQGTESLSLPFDGMTQQ